MIIENNSILFKLPNEILLYIFRNFLDLADIWCLYQTSTELRYFVSNIIQTRWKIETTGNIMKLQCRSALIKLELLSRKFSFQQKSNIHLDKNGFFMIEHQNTSTAIVKFLTQNLHPSDELYSLQEQIENENGRYEPLSDEEEEIDEEEDMDLDEQVNQIDSQVETENRISCQRVPFGIVIHHLLNTQNKSNQDKKIKQFEELLEQEEKLYNSMIRGIISYQHQYVLIEDIDLRNRVRAIVDLVFHHAVFVSGISRRTCITTGHRTFAAMMVRFLRKMDQSLSGYGREISFTLADNIKAFLEFTGYRLMMPNQHSSTLDCISACFDLMGAAFVGKMLSDHHVDCAVQRISELLSNDKQMVIFKRNLLMNLLDHWILIKREVNTSQLCRYIKLEIEKCNRYI